jgi:MFS family permease
VSNRSPLRRRDFRLLLAGQTASQLGAQVSAVAIPLLAVLTLDASPLQLGLVSAAQTVAFALIGLPSGAWVDRWRRRPILIASDVIRAVLLATIPIAFLLDVLTITQLIIVSLLAGAARVFFDVAYQSYLPSVIGRDQLLSGNSAMETVRASGQIVGPGIGGWLVALAGAANVVLIQAVTFAASAVSLAAIRTREPALPAPADPPRMWPQVKEGLLFVARTPILRATAITSGLGNFAFAMASAVTVVFMVRTLHLSATAVGVVVALGSVTVMIGAALTPRMARRVGSARIIWLSLAVTAPLGMLTPLARPGLLVTLLVVGMAAGELGQIVYAITNVSLRQKLCPPYLLGRVSATMRFLMMGLFPLGALFGGVVGEVLGLRAALWLTGGVIALSTLPVYRVLRQIRDVDEIPSWEPEEVASGPR